MILTQVKRFSVKIQLVWGILAAASAVLLPQFSMRWAWFRERDLY